MPSLSETARALYGAYRLARMDAGGMAFFDATVDGFWKSFFAAVLVAPFYLVLMFVRMAGGGVEASVPRYLAVEAIAYVISWVIFPLVMVTLVRLFDREDRYLGFIVAYNWAAALQYGIYMPVAILTVGGVLLQPLGDIIAFGVLIAIMLYSWFVTRVALRVPGMLAALLVALDLILSLFVSAAAESLL